MLSITCIVNLQHGCILAHTKLKETWGDHSHKLLFVREMMKHGILYSLKSCFFRCLTSLQQVSASSRRHTAPFTAQSNTERGWEFEFWAFWTVLCFVLAFCLIVSCFVNNTKRMDSPAQIYAHYAIGNVWFYFVSYGVLWEKKAKSSRFAESNRNSVSILVERPILLSFIRHSSCCWWYELIYIYTLLVSKFGSAAARRIEQIDVYPSIRFFICWVNNRIKGCIPEIHFILTIRSLCCFARTFSNVWGPIRFIHYIVSPMALILSSLGRHRFLVRPLWLWHLCIFTHTFTCLGTKMLFSPQACSIWKRNTSGARFTSMQRWLLLGILRKLIGGITYVMQFDWLLHEYLKIMIG